MPAYINLKNGKNPSSKGLAQAEHYYQIGCAAHQQGAYEQALASLKPAYHYFKKQALFQRQGNAAYLVGTSALMLKKYPKAKIYLDEARVLAGEEDLGLKAAAILHYGICLKELWVKNSFHSYDAFKSAESYLTTAIDNLQALIVNQGLKSYEFMLGLAYLNLSECLIIVSRRADNEAEQAIQLFKRNGNLDELAYAYHFYALALQHLKQYEQATLYSNKSKLLFSQLKALPALARNSSIKIIKAFPSLDKQAIEAAAHVKTLKGVRSSPTQAGLYSHSEIIRESKNEERGKDKEATLTI